MNINNINIDLGNIIIDVFGINSSLIPQIEYHNKSIILNLYAKANLSFIKNYPTILQKQNLDNYMKERVNETVNYLKSINYSESDEINNYIAFLMEAVLLYINYYVVKSSSSFESMNKEFYPCDIFITIANNPDLERLYMPLILEPYIKEFKEALSIANIPKELDKILLNY